MTKLIGVPAVPLIWPAESEVVLTTVTKVEVVDAELMIVPPVPGNVPALERLPTTCELPLRSSLPPALTVKALAAASKSSS